MPPVPRPRPRPTRQAAAARRAVTSTSTSGVPDAQIGPEAIAAIRASVQGKEQAPTSRQQAGSAVDWSKVRDQLGDPFDVERIPLSRLRLMRRDPMLSFGMSFIKTPFARAKWFIDAKDSNGPNAEVSANVDWALRRIFASYVFQWSNILDFGFQAIAKRYELRIPTGTYIDSTDGGEKTEQALWNQGNIQPVVWKPFIALPPDTVVPIWSSNGDFDGIEYDAGSGANAPKGVGAASGSDQAKFNIDIYHSLWATHDKEQNFGSIFGYSRLAYAYRYWWSYWFRWAIADQAFEKKADPGIVVRHPDGDFEDESGNIVSYREYALEMGERLRSGATISLPSEVYMGEIDGKPSSTRLWDIESIKDAINFDPFDKSFDYLDIQKLRSLWIPEQAFLEGKGGTSSRNVAKEMGESFVESQAVLASQLVESINRWIIPQFLASNFPEFMAANGTAEIVMQGFADQDVEARNMIFQFVGQQDFGARELLKIVDLEKMCDDAGVPMLGFRDQKIRENQIAAEAQALNPVPTEPVPGAQVGVVPSSTGFSYIQPRERIVVTLSDSSSSFLERLPASRQYTDPQVKRAARLLWQQWHDMYQEEYSSFADYLESQGDVIEFSHSDNVRKAARRLVKAWETNLNKLGTVLDRTTDTYKKVMRRASAIEAKQAKLEGTIADDISESWITNHAAEFISSVSFTTREELTDFVANEIESGVTDSKELAQRLRDHFSDFPQWKADRLARTEIREAYNAGTLLTAMANGAPQVQAIDGTGDPDCAARNGQLFTVDEAFQEREHPNGTLGWRIIPVELSVTYADELDDGAMATFDRTRGQITFSSEIEHKDKMVYMLAVGDAVAF